MLNLGGVQEGFLVSNRPRSVLRTVQSCSSFPSSAVGPASCLQTLGRADNLAEYIRRGRSSCWTEITLAGKPLPSGAPRDYVLRRDIKVETNQDGVKTFKTIWRVNGRCGSSGGWGGHWAGCSQAAALYRGPLSLMGPGVGTAEQGSWTGRGIYRESLHLMGKQSQAKQRCELHRMQQ